MKIETVPIGDVELDPANLRLHPERNVSSIKASLQRFGQQKPIVVDPRGIVIAGNGVLEAARTLGWTHVDIVRTTLQDAEAIAYAIADNRLGELSNWDEPALAGVLEALAKEDGSVLEAIGYKDGELAALVDDARGDVIEDEAPPLPAEAVSKLGDVWLLGDHRVVCGDAGKVETPPADVCFTSPPYLQQREYTTPITDWDSLMQGVFGNLPMADGGQVFVNLGLVHRDGEWLPYWDAWIQWMRAQGWRRFGWYVWDQGPGLPGDWNGRFAPSHEFVFHFNRQPRKPRKTVDKQPASVRVKKAGSTGMRGADGKVRKICCPEACAQPRKIEDSVIRVMRFKGAHEGDHPAVFPVGLPAVFLGAWPGIVYDPFLGSGTTLIAAEQLDRICYGIEIEPRYVDVTLRRWMNLTGNSPVRESDGAKFSDLSPTVVPDRIAGERGTACDEQAKGQRTA